MNIIEAGLLLVGGAAVYGIAIGYSHSRKIYLQEQRMSRLEDAVTAVEQNDAQQDALIALNAQQLAEKDAIIAQLRDDCTGALSLEGQNALAARLEKLFAPNAPEAGSTPDGDDSGNTGNSPAIIGNDSEIVAEPVTDESGEVVGEVLPDETGEIASGPSGEATPESIV